MSLLRGEYGVNVHVSSEAAINYPLCSYYVHEREQYKVMGWSRAGGEITGLWARKVLVLPSGLGPLERLQLKEAVSYMESIDPSKVKIIKEPKAYSKEDLLKEIKEVKQAICDEITYKILFSRGDKDLRANYYAKGGLWRYEIYNSVTNIIEKNNIDFRALVDILFADELAEAEKEEKTYIHEMDIEDLKPGMKFRRTTNGAEVIIINVMEGLPHHNGKKLIVYSHKLVDQSPSITTILSVNTFVQDLELVEEA